MPSKLVMETPLEPRATDKQFCATSQRKKASFVPPRSLFSVLLRAWLPWEQHRLCLVPLQCAVKVQRYSSDPPDMRHPACFHLLASSQLPDDACYWLTALP